MNKKLPHNEQGLAHVALVGLVVVVVAVIGFTGYTVASKHAASKHTASLASASTSSGAKSTLSTSPGTKSTAATVPTATSPNTTTTSSGSATTKTTTGSSSTTPVASTPAPTPVSTPTPTPTTYVPAGYTNLGTISAAALYNVKSPPASIQQPNMTVYACQKTINSTTKAVQYLGVLSYAVPQASSANWFVDLDLSSSASADNIVSSKAATYSYQNHTWQTGTGGASVSTVTTTDSLNPGAITDFYVWAYGSYGGTVLQPLGSHQNITQLQTCQ